MSPRWRPWICSIAPSPARTLCSDRIMSVGIWSMPCSVPGMPIASPYPEVTIPDTALTPFVLERAQELGDKPALDRRAERPDAHLRAARGRRSGAFAGGLQARGFEKGDTVAILLPERARVRGRVARHRVRRRHRHDRQPGLQRRGDRPPAQGRRREVPRRLRPGAREREEGRGGDGRRGDLRARRGRGRDAGHRAARRAAGRAGRGRPRRHRRAAVLERHHRPAEGRDALAPQPRREHPPGAPRRSRWRTTTSSSASCRSSTSTA